MAATGIRVAVSGCGVTGRLTVEGNEGYATYQVDPQATVVPETMDAIRPLGGAVANGPVPIRMTDEALGPRRDVVVGGILEGAVT